MKRYIRVLFISMLYSFKIELTYKFSFFIKRVAQILAYGVAFILMRIMINNFGTINGWNKYEVMLLYAMSLLSYSLAGALVIGLYNQLQDDICNGTFDDVLVKPMSVLPYLITTRFTWAYISHIILSLLVMIYCFPKLVILWDIWQICFLVVSIITGSIIYFSLLLIIRTPVFFFVKFDSVSDLFFFFREMSYYPVSIYPDIVQGILIFVLPYAFINYVPLHALLNKKDSMYIGNIFIFVSPIVSIFLLLIAVLFFNYGVRKYKSSGS